MSARHGQPRCRSIDVPAEESPHILRPWIEGEAMTIGEAARFLNVSTAHARRLVGEYNLGRVVVATWQFSRVAALAFVEGDAAALDLYRAGDRTHARVVGLYGRLGIALPAYLRQPAAAA